MLCSTSGKKIQGTHTSKYFLRYAVMLICLQILNYAGAKMESSNSISLTGRHFLVFYTTAHIQIDD